MPISLYLFNHTINSRLFKFFITIGDVITLDSSWFVANNYPFIEYEYKTESSDEKKIMLGRGFRLKTNNIK